MIARRLLYTGSGARMTSALLATSAVIVAPFAENETAPPGCPLVDSGLVAATEVVVVTVLPAIAKGSYGCTGPDSTKDANGAVAYQAASSNFFSTKCTVTLDEVACPGKGIRGRVEQMTLKNKKGETVDLTASFIAPCFP